MMGAVRASFLFGQSPISLELPESVKLLGMQPLDALPDAARAVREALDRPIGSPPLAEIARGKRTACVVISDITRPVPNQTILPPLLKVLEDSGIPCDAITILIATGMHRPNLGDELEYMLGREIAGRYRIVNHSCRDASNYRQIDEIGGAPIEVNRHYLDADLKILTGLIEPHFYAGYSGGRKAILPGISSYQTMKLMHSYRLIEQPRVTNCVLDGNPFHEYGLRVSQLAGVDFILNVVINRERKVAGVFAGHYDQAHRAGCELARANFTVELNEPADLVITSGGGFPLDATFYQVAKALTCAKDILRKGGTIVVACECREGLGSPEFSGILRSVRNIGEFVERYSDPSDFVIDQWCAQKIYQALDHAGRIYVFSSGLPQADIEKMGAIKVVDLQSTVNGLLSRHSRAVVSPDGPYVVGMLRQGESRTVNA
jgi:nickel-dependent lactate racemase